MFVQTHQTFSTQGHLSDYRQFATDCLKMPLNEQAGLKISNAEFEFPCQIVSELDPAMAQGDGYVNVCILAKKMAAPSVECNCLQESTPTRRFL